MNKLSIPTIKKGIYRHNKKGHLYEVIDVALQTETSELLVIYRPLYKSDYELFARPYEIFIGTIEINGKIVPRFEKVND